MAATEFPNSYLSQCSATPLAGGPYVVGASEIAKGSIVAIGSDGLLVVCGANGAPLGIVYETFAVGATATVYSIAPGEVCRGLASGSITKGDVLQLAASGAVSTEGAAGATRSANSFAVALEAATTTNPFRFQVMR